MRRGSYRITARLCSGCRNATWAGISSEPAKVSVMSPSVVRHGVAIDHHQASLRVHHQPGAVVEAVGNARHRVRHLEIHQHQRWLQRAQAPVALRRETGGGRRRQRCDADLRQRLAGPVAQPIVARAQRGREPAAVDAHAAQPGAARIVEFVVTDRHSRLVRQRPDDGQELVQARGGVAVDLDDHRAARHGRGRQHVARVGDINARQRLVEVARLLV
jgi:hypothetical protein